MKSLFLGPRFVPEITLQENNYFPMTSYYDYLAHYESSPWKSKGKPQLNSYKQWLMRILRKDDEVTTLGSPPQKGIPEYEKNVSHMADSVHTLPFSFDDLLLCPPPHPRHFPSVSHPVFIFLQFIFLSLFPWLPSLSPPLSLPSALFSHFHARPPTSLLQCCVTILHGSLL